MRRFITANGEYFLLCAPGGELRPDALSIFRAAARSGADFIYADAIERLPEGKERRIVKPAASPDTLLSYNYIGSPLAVSRALLERAGAPGSGSYSERWAFTLRAFFLSDFILRVPRALYAGPPERPEADAALIEAALRRLKRPGEAWPATAPGYVTVRYACPPETRLSVVIASCGRPEALRDTIESMERRNMSARLEYVVAEGGAPDERKEAYLKALEACGVKLLYQWYERNEARLYNLASELASGDALLFLRAGDRIESDDAPADMLPFAMQEHIGAVSAKSARPAAAEAYVRNVSTIWRAPMLSRDKLLLAGGFDESFAKRGCVPALSITLKERRFHLLETPGAVIRPADWQDEPDEKTRLRCGDLSL
ncbi:MAG: hypothetical protein Q4C13_08455 [Clostridia bacterium]|nr:hypothetical protein [Clostridia bacterium]